MNPDMTVVELARIIGTNRTYLTENIQAMGYSSYPDIINRRRINYICEKLREEPTATITQLMFEVGFRSRSQASREFKRIQGCTPTEYANKKSL